MGKAKYVIGALIILLSIGLYWLLSTAFNVDCSGWNMISPICWLGSGLDFISTLLGIMILIGGVFLGVLVMLINENNYGWIMAAIFFLIVTGILLIFTPGLPDEWFTAALSLAMGAVGVMKSGGGSSKEISF